MFLTESAISKHTVGLIYKAFAPVSVRRELQIYSKPGVDNRSLLKKITDPEGQLG
jgi:hypothetical protein